MKNNNFEEEYKASKEIEASYDAAKDAEDKEGMEAAQTEMREMVDSINAKETGCRFLFESRMFSLENCVDIGWIKAGFLYTICR